MQLFQHPVVVSCYNVSLVRSHLVGCMFVHILKDAAIDPHRDSVVPTFYNLIYVVV